MIGICERKWFFSFDRNDQGNNFFAFDWKEDFSEDKKLTLANGTEAHFVVRNNRMKINIFCLFFKVFKELIDAYFENTDQLDRRTLNLYIHPALHLTNLLPFDVQCSIDVSAKQPIGEEEFLRERERISMNLSDGNGFQSFLSDLSTY